MSAVAYGTATGFALAFAALIFGFWGFLLVAVLGAIGAVTALIASGRINLRGAVDGARRRRVA